MKESSLEQLVPEKDFVPLLQGHADVLFRLANTLLATPSETWTKRHYFQLYSEADELESFLDDYGARYNQTFNYLTELIASVRGFALAGLSLVHLVRRLEGYGALGSLAPEESERAVSDIRGAHLFVNDVLRALMTALQEEARHEDVALPTEFLELDPFEASAQRFSLPRNMGQEDLEDEAQKIAEVASKYLQACTMMRELGVRRIEDEAARAKFLRNRGSEEHARVYEATVHNLQSAYDTHIKNTVLEAGDDRLPRLRGHVSSVLHLLEAVTQLTHFVERHESGVRTEAAERRLAEIVHRVEVEDITLNRLLYWADRLIQAGRGIAEELLPTYTNLQALEVELQDGLTLHARPVSLIVAIVNHYGTPVEMEVQGHICNASSILELMIAAGSHVEARQYTFRGDENPLRDIALLFESALGEEGIDKLPDQLSYLRND